MNQSISRYFRFTSPLCAFAFAISGTMAVADQTTDPENLGIKYEDDAWYDVSEWFDSNDYNPTDEAIGRWDNEKFTIEDKQTSTDNDNDTEAIPASEFYGEDYDDGYGQFSDRDEDGYFETYGRYFDSDDDNLYDTYATYYDQDGDNLYDGYELSKLSNLPKNVVPSEEVAQTTQRGLSGKPVSITGTISNSKFVDQGWRLSRMVKVDAKDGESVWVDLGSNRGLQVFQGDELTVYGPVVKTGDKKVLVATVAEVQGEKVLIERRGLRYSGKIDSMRTATVHGKKKLVAKLKTEEGKMLTVDMGPARMKDRFSKGDDVTVTGVPVQIGDRVILIADTNTL